MLDHTMCVYPYWYALLFSRSPKYFSDEQLSKLQCVHDHENQFILYVICITTCKFDKTNFVF